VAWWAHIGGFIFGIVFLKVFRRMPSLGVSRRIRSAGPERGTHRLQVIRTFGREGGADLYGRIRITPREAREGTRKLVNVPWGVHRRLLRVQVPPGVREGSVLRLAGLGRRREDGRAGDLRLEVEIEVEGLHANVRARKPRPPSPPAPG
jgi:hypothetical protein